VRSAFSAVVGGVVLAVVVSIAVPEAGYVAAGLALIALLLGLPLVRRTHLLIGLLLIGVGLVTGTAALLLGFEIVPLELLSLNQDIIGMLGGVAFLGFIARTVGEVRPRLRGAPAVWRTALVTHLLGSVINLSAITVVGDHLRRSGPLRAADAMLVTRSFAAAGFWSPFWAGSALALAFAPGANLGLVVAVGAPLAAIVVATTMPTVLRSLGDGLPEYRGYALSWQLLRIPLALLLLVLALHLALPEVPMPRLIAAGAITVMLVATLLREPARFGANVAAEIRTVLPNLTGEVVLFVSAGIMALGLSALLGTLRFALPVAEYSVPLAWAGVLVMALLVIVGVHPVITIGLIGSLVVPLHPDPTLFVAAVMIGWAAAAATGPLNGLQMYMQSRYGVSGLSTTRRNLPYLAAALLLGLPALYLVAWLSGLLATG